jgi:hypothetical protein
VIQHNPAKRESKHFVKLAIENHIISPSSIFLRLSIHLTSPKAIAFLGFHPESQEGNIQKIPGPDLVFKKSV